MAGTITRRGKHSWRLKYDLPRDDTGQRRLAYATVRGTRQDAERELRARLKTIDDGMHVDPSKETVGEYLTYWLENVAPLQASPVTLQGYSVKIRKQILPHLGPGEDDRAQSLVADELMKSVEALLVRTGKETASRAQVGRWYRLVADRRQRLEPGVEPRRIDLARQRRHADPVAGA